MKVGDTVTSDGNTGADCDSYTPHLWDIQITKNSYNAVVSYFKQGMSITEVTAYTDARKADM